MLIENGVVLDGPLILEVRLAHGRRAQLLGSKAVEVVGFADTTAGQVGPIALQMHKAGLFDEYKDMSIEVNPATDGLITPT